jgi:hypothetical protein
MACRDCQEQRRACHCNILASHATEIVCTILGCQITYETDYSHLHNMLEVSCENKDAVLTSESESVHRDNILDSIVAYPAVNFITCSIRGS